MGANGVSRQQGTVRRLDLRVPAEPPSLAWVRRSMHALAIPPGLVDDAELLVTELVGNSIKHAGLSGQDEILISADWSDTRLRVSVHDRAGPAGPASVAGTIHPAAGAESGWGLFIVDRLASRWGTDETGYWFELDERRTTLG